MSKRTIFTLLTSSLVLFSCGPVGFPQDEDVQQPPRSLGVYTANITVDPTNETVASAQVRPLEGSLSAASTRGIGGLKIAASNVTVFSDGNGNKYYTATLTVTNNGNKDVIVPTFVPLGLDNAKPFRNIKDRSGAVLDSTKVNIVATQGRRGSAGNAELDPFATRFDQYAHGLKTTDFVAPQGQTVTNLHSDHVWLAPPLIKGATQTVQLGFQLPSSNVFSFSLVFGVADAVNAARTQPISTRLNDKPYTWYDESRRAPTTEELKMIPMVNEARSKSRTCGKTPETTTSHEPVPPLIWNEKLAHSALNHSVDMAQRDYFKHDTPDGVGVGNRVAGAEYAWSSYGENLTRRIERGGAQNTLYPAREAVDNLLKSPGHCRIIMKGNYKELGVGLQIRSFTDGTRKHYWTQNFGTHR